MSHNYPYRRPPPAASDSWPDHGTYSSSDRHHTSEDYDFYRHPHEPSSHLSSSSSGALGESSYSASRSDSALSLLSSCGLEPNDLALLAELPEDVLTVESLPHLLQEIKGKRGANKPYSPMPSSSSSSSSSSRPSASSRLPATSPSNSDWDNLRSQPMQYPLDHTFITPKPLPPEQVQDWQDRWGNPRRTSSVTYKPSSSANPPSSSSSPSPSSSSSNYIVDYDHRVRSADYDKNGRDGGSGSRYDRPSYSSAATGNHSRNPASHLSQPGSADYRIVPPSDEYRAKTRAQRREPDVSSSRSSSTSKLDKMPSKKAALDFHGTVPTSYPYSCSLCDITVLTEKFWFQHINGSQHADGQLTLLQRYPDWDCRMETVSRADSQSEKPKDEGRNAHQSRTTTQISYALPNKKTPRKSAGNSKVVCVKFPAHSVDEKHLRTLTEPFGKIVKVIMFPSLAFVELGSSDQAKDLVKYYENHPPCVKDETLSFYISNTFNFLQSSQVLRFCPAPAGEDGYSDLISITKRFGPPLYTLFLPSIAFVELKNAEDAQKLVDYYSSNTLKINGETIKVAFSGEYNTLMRVSSAKKYEEESSSTKRTKSPSSSTDESTPSKRSKSSREREDKEGRREKGERGTRSRSRSRSRSRDRSSRAGRSKEKAEVPEKSQQTKTEPKEASPRSRSTVKSRSRSRSRSRDRSTRAGRSKERAKVPDKTQTKAEPKADRAASPRSKDKSRSRSRSRDRSTRAGGSRETAKVPDKTEQTKTEPKPASPVSTKPETSDNAQTEVEAVSSEDESDIEGMEVIGEDGENLEDEDMEVLDDADEEEEENEEEEGDGVLEEEEDPADTVDSPEQEKREEEEKSGESGDEEKPVKEEEEGEGKEEVPEKEATPGITIQKEESETSGGPEETTETQPEEDEEEPDFPEDLENCITLDELDEDNSDDQDDRNQDKSKSGSTRVIYFRNLPQRFYTDADFVKIVKGFGRVARYFLIRNRQEGFIEMSSSSEALRAVRELSFRNFEFNGYKLTIQISHKYRRLTGGWKVQSDSELDEERRKETRSRSSRRSERSSRSKTSEREEPGKKSSEQEESNRKSAGRKESSKKTPEKESTARKTPDKELTGKKTVEKEELSAKNIIDKESTRTKTQEKELTGKKTVEKEELSAKKTPEKELVSKKTPEKKSTRKKTTEKAPNNKKTPEKESRQKTPEKEDLAQKTHENEKLEREKTPEKELGAEKSPDEEMKAEEEDLSKKTPEEDPEDSGKNSAVDEEMPEVKAVCSEETAPDPEKPEEMEAEPSSTTDASDSEQRASGDGLEEAGAAADAEQQSEPAGGAAEPPRPTKPVGTEFVRPVVGYFCNLCQIIYADEDEAKTEHCSTLGHYQKYQERTGKDPWAD